jgi:glycosidase
LYTMRGIPSTYYGTEILMKETENHGVIREDFPGGFVGDSLNKFTAQGRTASENEAFDYIKTLLNWRKSSEAITEGSFTHFVPADDVYVYARISASDTVLVLVNTNQNDSRMVDLKRFEEVWPQGTEAINVLSQNAFSGNSIELPKMSISILQKKK